MIAASTAHSAVTGSIQDNSNGTETVVYDVTGGDIVDVVICAAGTVACEFGNRLYSLATVTTPSLGASPVLFQEGTLVVPESGGAGVSLPAGNYVFTLLGTAGMTITTVVSDVSVTIGAAGSTSSSVAQTFKMSLASSDGTVCLQSSKSGTAATWVALPGASDCTPPASKAGATLLGWVTYLSGSNNL